MTAARTWEALPLALRAALLSGATVVTPNNRLARQIAAVHDDAQHMAGRVVWPAPVVVPWNGWLERLWLDVMASGCRPDAPRRIASGQSAYLWARIVAAEALPLMDENGAADLAADAWSLVHAWGAGGPSWRSWSGGDDDGAVFARWAEDYAGTIARMGGVDDAQLPDWLARCAPEVPAWRNVSIALAGFIELTPQQERLLPAAAAAGMRIARFATVPDGGDDAIARASRVAGATPRDEIARAMRWARDRALADPGATIAIAIEDLGSRREEIRALAEEILCPSLRRPGREAAARPFNFSLGTPAGDVPLVAAALDLIALAHAPLPMARAATLLRSPYIAAATDAWWRRARLEADWLGEGRRDISLADVIAAIGGADPAFAHFRRAVGEGQRRLSAAAPREWVEAWRAWLAAAGWPGDRVPSSAEWQARGAWDDLLAEFAALGFVVPRIRRAEAVAALLALARRRVFQPEAPPASIQILGLLEAAGLPLDALWVAGLAAECWPPAPQPNPLLPLPWQRERNVPRSTAARELAYAQALTLQWARGAPEVVFSYAVTVDDHPRTISALVATAAVRREGNASPTTARAQFDAAPARETIVDDRAPSLPVGSSVRGGAGLIAAQSDCPFRALAVHRLGADTWPVPVDGLSALERGVLVHGALAAFWRNVVDHATLVALPHDALLRRIDAAVADAVRAVPAARWGRLPAVVAAGEAIRIAKTVRAWLDGFDRARPAFTVAGVEVSRPIALGGLELALRVDRIDALADGGTAIIDYKTGAVLPPVKWFDPRPQEPQLGLYLLAQHAFDPDHPVRAVAYAQLKPGAVKAQGIAADAAAWPGLPEPSALTGVSLADWPAAESHWRHSLEALAVEVREGRAAVAPRDAIATCRRCGLQPLCRIGASSVDGDTEGGDA